MSASSDLTLLVLNEPLYTLMPFDLSSLAVHYVIALLQNINFLSWWGPAYAFLLTDPTV